MLGLRDLVRFLRESLGQRHYYINSYKNMCPDILVMASVCARAAQVSNTSLKFMFDEDLVPKHLAAIDAQIASERDKIMCLPSCVFQFFEDLCE